MLGDSKQIKIGARLSYISIALNICEYAIICKYILAFLGGIHNVADVTV